VSFVENFCLFSASFQSFLQGHLIADRVDVIVAIQPVISDGRLAPVLAQHWQHPLVLWATPEEQAGEMISGNSLVSPIS